MTDDSSKVKPPTKSELALREAKKKRDIARKLAIEESSNVPESTFQQNLKRASNEIDAPSKKMGVDKLGSTHNATPEEKARIAEHREFQTKQGKNYEAVKEMRKAARGSTNAASSIDKETLSDLLLGNQKGSTRMVPLAGSDSSDLVQDYDFAKLRKALLNKDYKTESSLLKEADLTAYGYPDTDLYSSAIKQELATRHGMNPVKANESVSRLLSVGDDTGIPESLKKIIPNQGNSVPLSSYEKAGSPFYSAKDSIGSPALKELVKQNAHLTDTADYNANRQMYKNLIDEGERIDSKFGKTSKILGKGLQGLGGAASLYQAAQGDVPSGLLGTAAAVGGSAALGGAALALQSDELGPGEDEIMEQVNAANKKAAMKGILDQVRGKKPLR